MKFNVIKLIVSMSLIVLCLCASRVMIVEHPSDFTEIFKNTCPITKIDTIYDRNDGRMYRIHYKQKGF